MDIFALLRTAIYTLRGFHHPSFVFKTRREHRPAVGLRSRQREGGSDEQYGRAPLAPGVHPFDVLRPRSDLPTGKVPLPATEQPSRHHLLSTATGRLPRHRTRHPLLRRLLVAE